MNKLVKLIRQPDAAMRKVLRKCSPLIKNDRTYLSLMYFLAHGRRLHWDNPLTFNEKINWLKLWSKDRGYEQLTDKLAVRQYISQTIGPEYLIPLLGSWDDPSQIPFGTLPERYVLKTTHDSGGVWIVKPGTPPPSPAAIRKRMRHNYFWGGREYVYKNITPRVMAEEFMVDESGWDLKDYKFFCFDGKPEILFMASERHKTKGQKAKFDYLDMNLRRLPIYSKGHEQNPECDHLDVPNFELMKSLAARLSAGFPFIRVDFYNINGRVYFGEMTFFHDDGMVPLRPAEWNRRLGDMIPLPR